MNEQDHPTVTQLSYEHPQTPSRRIGPEAVLMLGALGLIALAGCFCIGIMVLVTNNVGTPFAWTTAISVLLLVLYVVVFGCLGGAVFLFVLAIRRLMAR